MHIPPILSRLSCGGQKKPEATIYNIFFFKRPCVHSYMVYFIRILVPQKGSSNSDFPTLADPQGWANLTGKTFTHYSCTLLPTKCAAHSFQGPCIQSGSARTLPTETDGDKLPGFHLNGQRAMWSVIRAAGRLWYYEYYDILSLPAAEL